MKPAASRQAEGFIPQPPNFIKALLVACVLLLATACGGRSATKSATPIISTVIATTAARGATATPGATATKPSVPPSPTTPAGGAVASDETVRFAAPDGYTMTGHLYAAPGAKRRLAIFALPAPEAETAWQPFARELANGGVAALTVQMPLFMDPAANYPGASNPTLMERYLESAVGFMESRDYPLIYVVGDFTAGTAALKLAAHHPLAGVVTVSAPSSFGGLDVRPDLASITTRKLFVASRGDNVAADAIPTFMQNAPEPKQSQIYEGGAHGSQFLTGPSANATAFKQLLTEFLTK